METQKSNLEKLRVLHDTCKHHPYWLDFDPTKYPSLKQELLEMYRVMYDECKIDTTNFVSDRSAVFNNRYAPVFYALLHDFNNAMGARTFNHVGTERFGRWILIQQLFICLVHQMIMDWEEVFILLPADDLANWDRRLKTEYDKDLGGWRLYCEIKRDQKPQLEEYFLKRIDHAFNKDVWKKELKEIRDETSTFYRFIEKNTL